MRSPGRVGDVASRLARPPVAVAHDDVDWHGFKALCQAGGDLLAERGQRVRVVLVAGLEGVGGIRLALAVPNDDELLIIGHAAIRSMIARMNSWVTSTSTASV